MRAEGQELPELFLERLRRIIPADRWDEIVHTFSHPKPTTFRVNSLKTSAPLVQERLSAEGFQLDPVPWYAEAFVLRGRRLRELQETELYRDGSIYVQSLSSMLPPLVLDPKASDVVLDVTAAPGSKTTQLACLMGGEGRIVANDNNRIRFFKLRANVIQQAARNVEMTLFDGSVFGRRRPESFDKVLADVPCTTEGRFQTADPKSYRFWKPIKIREMAHKQRRLLDSAIAALRPGGALVYSTCTFAPEENEEVIQWALRRWGDVVSLEPITPEFSNWLPGLRQWAHRAFDPSMERTRRILPTDEMEGFFLARLRKRIPEESSKQ